MDDIIAYHSHIIQFVKLIVRCDIPLSFLHPQKLTWIPKMMVWKRWAPLKYGLFFGIYMLDFYRFPGVLILGDLSDFPSAASMLRATGRVGQMP